MKNEKQPQTEIKRKSPYLLVALSRVLAPKRLKDLTPKERYQKALTKLIITILHDKETSKEDQQHQLALMITHYLLETDQAEKLVSVLKSNFDLSPI